MPPLYINHYPFSAPWKFDNVPRNTPTPPAPHQTPVVRRHRPVVDQFQSRPGGQRGDLLEVAKALVRGFFLQRSVESGVAVAGVAAAVVEGAVDDQLGAVGQHAGEAGEEGLDGWPGHDVQGVGGEGGVVAAGRPGAEDVKFERRQHVGQRRLGQPGADAGQEIRPVGGLPGQMRQVAGEVDGVLAGAAADFQHLPAVGEDLAEHGEDGLAVSGGGGGVGFFHGRRLGRMAPV